MYQIRAGGDCVRVGGTVSNTLKEGGTEKMGGETKGQGLNALKRVGWNPLMNYELMQNMQILLSIGCKSYYYQLLQKAPS